MKLRKLTAAALVTVMAGSLVACGGTSTAPTTAAPDTEAPTTAAPAADAGNKTEALAAELSGEISVTTWDYDTSPQYKVIIDAYTAKNPNVKVKVIDTAAAEYNDSLGVSLSAAQPDPDVIWVKDMGSMLQMADKKQLMPISDLIARDNVDLSAYNGSAEQLQYNGESYCLPFRSDWYILFYNKDLFDAAGVPYPSNDMTWEEYWELAGKMTSGEGSSKVYGSHNHTWEALVSAWAVQDGKHTVVEKDYAFYKPWYEATLALQDNGYIQDYATLKTANIHYRSVFFNEQCAMLPIGTYFIPTVIQAMNDGECDFNWGIATIPHPSSVEAGYTVGSVTPLGVSAYTDQKELAWDFVKFATSEEAAQILSNVGVFPAIQTPEILNNISTAEGFPEGESCKEALNVKNLVFDRPLDPQIEAVRVPLNEVHEMIMIGEYTVDEGIAELNKRVGEIKGW